jgi:putative solute:sodium symporter small subunit
MRFSSKPDPIRRLGSGLERNEVADGSERSWWLRTRFLAIAAVVAGGIVSLLLMLLSSAFTSRLFGIPLGIFAATFVAPAIVIVVIFWAAERQRRLDHAHDFFES